MAFVFPAKSAAGRDLKAGALLSLRVEIFNGDGNEEFSLTHDNWRRRWFVRF
ncbi:hypothetical protein [Stakelama marina]|uniref:Uncharacterized protein n=1 Tax=Stakelama marina TaxID=2826939 RepID=A0A8T4IHE6_9SPHN|nr:hypothetical protein [Stakelama marina]MBR0553931.1 hypothetical protein [Stakelama marina]